ncbi:hypothetical protein PSTT_11368 [Puccinia striiformis]|uniref:rRNA biogenesis protein RRP36 n=1 Tax=Puccinia striiformis TaxID=27350 RepID=A0A2S4V0J7_9BASI|nr:hypothetical protein PSTT_11368 [Puccinia striiformis]
MKSRQTSKKASFEKADRGSGIEDELVEEDGLHDEEDTNDEEDDEDDDDDGSLTDESEDEWAEERKAVRYIAESELEDNDLDLSSDDQSDDMSKLGKTKLVSATTTKRDNEEEGTSSSTNRNRHQITKKTTSGQEGISESEEAAKKAYSSRKPIAHRSHKHAPIEISSKKAVTRKRTIVEVPKIERRDPRFDSLSGAVNEVLHQKSFGFLKEQRRLEIEELRQTLNKAKKKGQQPLESLELLQEQLRREENKEVQMKKSREKNLLYANGKLKKESKGKKEKGHFISRKAQKEVVLTDRYEHLSQNKSKLNKSIERKRKKVDGKDKKSMPNKRQRPSQE